MPETPRPVPLAEAIEAFLLSCEAANHTPATRHTYAYNLERFLRTSGLQFLEDMTPEVV